jgi:glycosyltransferase involved in cell wall biosynthesis
LRVAAQTVYPPLAASARIRVENFVPHLSALGVELDYRPMLTDREYAGFVRGARATDVALPAAASLARLARRQAAKPGVPVLVHRLRSLLPAPGLEFRERVDIYDFDDAMYLQAGVGTGGLAHAIKREAQRWHAYVKKARIVIAGNETLAAAALEANRRVEVIPSCVEPSRQPLRKHADRELITVGWIGSPATSGFLLPLLVVFERINRGGQSVRLVCVGAGPLPSASWLEQRPWSLETEATDLTDFDIGIMPLPNDPWNQGKCGYKLLQYFSAGVPVIASPVGLNKKLVAADRGRLAESPEDWERALLELIADAAARAGIGAAGRALVEAEYSYDRWAPELASLLRSVSG